MLATMVFPSLKAGARMLILGECLDETMDL